MDFVEQLRVLQAAQGPAKLALATVDLAYPALPDAERAQLKEALEAVAIPHWCDEAILAALLEVPVKEATARLARLRGLSVVEAFLARGDSAVNVHEAARLALRRRLAIAQSARFQQLTQRAAAHFALGTGTHARIEVVFHQALVQPEAGADGIDALCLEWGHGGRFEELQALSAALAELRTFPGVPPLPRAVAAERFSWIRQQHQPVENTIAALREAIATYRAAGDEFRLARTFDLLGPTLIAAGQPEAARDVLTEALAIARGRLAASPANSHSQRHVTVALLRLGDLDAAQGRPDDARRTFADGLEIVRRLAQSDPANTEWQRDVSVSLNKLGDLDAAQGRPDDARRAFAEGLEIVRRLAQSDPANTLWQRDVSLSIERLGDLDAAQGRPDDARRAFAEGLEIRRRLAQSDPANTLWQRDVFVSHTKMASLESEPAAKHQLLTQALPIVEKLAALDPKNLRWQKDLALVKQRLAALK